MSMKVAIRNMLFRFMHFIKAGRGFVLFFIPTVSYFNPFHKIVVVKNPDRLKGDLCTIEEEDESFRYH